MNRLIVDGGVAVGVVAVGVVAAAEAADDPPGKVPRTCSNQVRGTGLILEDAGRNARNLCTGCSYS